MNADRTKFRGANFKHFKNFMERAKVMDILPLCHKFVYKPDRWLLKETGVFRPMPITADYTSRSVTGVLVIKFNRKTINVVCTHILTILHFFL